MMATDMATIGAAYAALTTARIAVPADFAAAYVLTRPLKRPRLPLELACAAGLVRVAPWLGHVRVTRIITNLLPGGAASAPSSGPADLGTAGSASAPASPGVLARVMRGGVGLIDRYGLAYQLGARVVGLSVLLGTFSALRAGVDVQGWLMETWGVSPGTGEAVGTWAAAVAASSAAYPASIAVAAQLSPHLARLFPALARSSAHPPSEPRDR
jgi:hypothetical protein